MYDDFDDFDDFDDIQCEDYYREEMEQDFLDDILMELMDNPDTMDSDEIALLKEMMNTDE